MTGTEAQKRHADRKQDERRKTYALTQAGKEALRAEYRRLRVLVSDGEAMEVDKL